MSVIRRVETDKNVRPTYGGMTLIELLVVIVILTTVVAAAIPIMSPTNDDRRLREATRGLNTYIFGAQTRAIALNRPYGIAVKRLSQDTSNSEDNAVAVEVFYVEQQPPFTGFDRTSAVQIAIDNGPNGGKGQVLVRFVRRGTGPAGQDTLPAGWDPDLLPSKTLRPGDIVEVRGWQFVLTDTGTNNSYLDSAPNPDGYYTSNSGNPIGTYAARPLNDTGQVFRPVTDNDGYALDPRPNTTEPPAPYWSEPSAYKVLRQPTPTSDPPYQLPEGTAIDLRASGVGHVDTIAPKLFYYQGDSPGDSRRVDNSQGILIMFAPEGRVSRVTYSRMPITSVTFDEPVVENVYLLIGRRQNAPPPEAAADGTLKASVMSGKSDEEMQELKETVNWLLGESRWIAIGAQSGRIVTVENAFVDPLAVAEQPSITSLGPELIRNAQIQKARQFTREMSQLGGR